MTNSMHRLLLTIYDRRIVFASVFVLALAVKVLYLILVVHPNSYPSNVDSIEHDQIARNVLGGEGYQLYGHATAYRAPLLTYAMVAIYYVFGERYVYVRSMMILLSLLLVWVSYLLARQVFGEKTALWSALITAVWPHFIFYGARIYTEIPFTLFSVLSLYFFVKYLDTRRSHFIYIMAVWLGLAILTRPTGFVLWALLLASLLVAKNVPDRFKTVLKAVLITFLIVLPWTVRNYNAFHQIVPVTSQGGTVLWISNNHYVAHHPYLWGIHILYQRLPGAEQLITPDELQRSRFGLKFTVQFLKKYPQEVPQLLWNKFLRFWHYQMLSGSSRKWLYEYAYLGVFALFLVGVVLSWREKNKAAQWLWLLILANLIPALIFWAGFRMRLPAEPALIGFGAYGLEKIGGWLWLKRP